ncbi:endonuclease [Vibrio sp. Isolate24]|uniref:endonuclease n=1 Tax=Vibrio sp. Isolate24 TaxID=2908534 RepID=UPI001EFD618C|nr:endonuclease [Vibrio sp. Isolate24]MCG9678955.1 endonuclease [Vibrio sp. Isolate24]
MKALPTTLLLLTFSIQAEQTVIPDYDSARDDWFWDKLYTYGGLGLYCSIPFDDKGIYINHKGQPKKMTLEHVYSADWIADHHGCDNRDTCETASYKRAEADLHNLWATHGGVNSSRSNYPFSEIPDEVSENRYLTKGCGDFERTYGVSKDEIFVEPQDVVKGRIARSMLYMNSEYGLPLRGMESLMLRWHIKYPVDSEELWRNYAVYKLQGTYNPWISQINKP